MSQQFIGGLKRGVRKATKSASGAQKTLGQYRGTEKKEGPQNRGDHYRDEDNIATSALAIGRGGEKRTRKKNRATAKTRIACKKKSKKAEKETQKTHRRRKVECSSHCNRIRQRKIFFLSLKARGRKDRKTRGRGGRRKKRGITKAGGEGYGRNGQRAGRGGLPISKLHDGEVLRKGGKKSLRINWSAPGLAKRAAEPRHHHLERPVTGSEEKSRRTKKNT